MIGLKIEKGVVVNAAVFNKLLSGWVEAPDGVVIGWIDNGDGTFSAPLKQPITDEELIANERNWRDAKLKAIDIEIFKAEDNGDDESSLRNYRRALRNYPQQEDFPHGTRPTL